jgi:translocation and assembly module TamB
VPLNVDVHGVQLAGALDSQSLTVNEVTARAKDGEIRGSGALALKQFAVSGVKLNFKAQRWPAIDTARYQLRVGGNVEVGGTLAAPLIGGRLNIDEGSLRPDLAFLEQSKAPTKRDPTIVVIKGGEAQVSEQQETGGQSSAANGFFDNLALDLAVRAPGNLWIRHSDLVSELSGDVRVRKEKTRDLDLTGRIEVVRGWFAFQGRRFQITRGTVQFTGGGKINPTIELTAEYRLPEYQVEARVSGTADKPSLALSSQPPLEQADILALVLFGRPLNTLDKNEQSSLQQSAVNLASGFVAAKIASSVATALGLDSLGIDIREVSSGQVGIGRYIGDRTYVSASQQLSGEHGNEVSLEYKIAKDWKIGTSATSTGDSGIDIIWHKRY